MARPNDEFAVAWESLSGTGDEPGWRTIPVTPAGRCRLSAGRRFPGNQEALLASFLTATIPAGEKLPDGQGFSVERVDPHGDGKTWIALTVGLPRRSLLIEGDDGSGRRRYTFAC